MTNKPQISSPLIGYSVALAESRQLDVLADMFEVRGAKVVRTPLVSILDSPHRQVVADWLREFIRTTPDYFVILTGEGIRRLASFAKSGGCKEKFVEALAKVIKISRGPKPGRALKELGLETDILGKAPTTAGIIESLAELSLGGKRVAVQLYGEEPNLPLIDYLKSKDAVVSVVAPYVYAPDVDTKHVLTLIDNLASGDVNIIAFTSQAQFTRLLDVARANDREAQLFQGLESALVTAVGPVVAEQLQRYGVQVDVCPEQKFFMKPMVRDIEKHLLSTACQGDGFRNPDKRY